MDTKLQDLTSKLYNEGVAKGNQEAEKIVAEAKNQAKEILEAAKVEADTLKKSAQKDSEELMKNTSSELQLASRQMIDTIKQELVDLVNGSVTASSVKAATADADFVQKLMLNVVQAWSAQEDLTVVVNEKDAEAVQAYFSSTVKAELNKVITIETANNIKAGFQVKPADGSYKMSFTEEDLMNFFKEFLRPKVVELLFQAK